MKAFLFHNYNVCLTQAVQGPDLEGLSKAVEGTGVHRRQNKLMCYPQQFGRSWRFLAVCPGTFWNLISHLRQNLWTSSAFGPGTLRNLGWSAPEPSRTRRNFISYLPRNLLEPHQPSAPEPLDLICFRPRNPPEPWLICTGALPNPPELHQLSAPEPSGTSSAICARTSGPHLLSAPEPSGTLADLHRSPPEPAGTSSAICTGTFWNLISHLRQNLWTSSAFGPGTLRNLGWSAPEPSRTRRNFISYLHRNLLEPHQPSAPKPLDLICFLPRNPPEPWLICTGALPNPPELHQLSAPEPSGTSSAIWTGTLRNFISHLHRTLRNLLRNLVLQLHRIAPELFWAKDPIASFAVGEKMEMKLLEPFLGETFFWCVWWFCRHLAVLAAF